jgi:hypothetical protein
LAQWRVKWLIEHSTSHQLLWCIDRFVPLRRSDPKSATAPSAKTLSVSLLRQRNFMKVDIENIFNHTIPLDDFQLKWRYTQEKYDKLPDQHLELLRPLDKAAAQFLSNYIDTTDLHSYIPLRSR